MVIQTVIGRGGSLLFQGLWDSHPQILMFPGMLNFYSKLWSEVVAGPEKWKEIIRAHLDFLDMLAEPLNIRKNLGERKDESIVIPKEEMISMLMGLKPSRDWQRRELFLAFHFVVAKAFHIQLEGKKIIYCHEHTVDVNGAWVTGILADFPSFRIFCCVRDPVSNYKSLVNWKVQRKDVDNTLWKSMAYQPDILLSYSVYWYLDGLIAASRFSSQFFFIRLEDLRAYRIRTLKLCAAIMEVEVTETMSVVSFGGKVWEGDVFSSKTSSYKLCSYSKFILSMLIHFYFQVPGILLLYRSDNRQKITGRFIYHILFLFWVMEDFREWLLSDRKFYDGWMAYFLSRFRSYRVYSYYIRLIRTEIKLRPEQLFSVSGAEL